MPSAGTFLPVSGTELSHLHQRRMPHVLRGSSFAALGVRRQIPVLNSRASVFMMEVAPRRANDTYCRCLAAGPGAVCSLVWSRSVTPLLLCFIIIVRCLLQRSGFQSAAEKYSQSAILIFIFIRLPITAATCTLNFISFMHLSSLFKPL